MIDLIGLLLSAALPGLKPQPGEGVTSASQGVFWTGWVAGAGVGGGERLWEARREGQFAHPHVIGEPLYAHALLVRRCLARLQAPLSAGPCSRLAAACTWWRWGREASSHVLSRLAQTSSRRQARCAAVCIGGVQPMLCRLTIEQQGRRS